MHFILNQLNKNSMKSYGGGIPGKAGGKGAQFSERRKLEGGKGRYIPV